MEFDRNSNGQQSGRILASILIITIFSTFFITNSSKRQEQNEKLTKCSKYTIGKVVKKKRWRFKTLLIYSFVLNGKKVEREDRPNPASLSEWWNLDYDQMLGRRLWVRAYCDDPKIHDALWHIEVPDTIKVVPENGWSALPAFAKTVQE